ncbi:MAG: hypothetical protein IJX98_02800 [Clostridia bacterium]|nr:hypothetical protein [Clostridia bacterium]
MQYFKKNCILRQLKQGFSCDGKPLSGIVKAEQYGKNIAVEVGVINLAPLSTGEYYCVIADQKKRFQVLPLKEKTSFSFLSDMEISQGFLAGICFVKEDLPLAIAYGTNGTINLELNAILKTAFFSPPKAEETPPAQEEIGAEESPAQNDYDDEAVTEENYFILEEEHDECERTSEIIGNAQDQGADTDETAQTGDTASQDADGECVRHAFTTQSDGYYQSIKGEIAELFEKYPRDDTLCGAFACSEWVRTKGEEGNPQQLVGLVYEDGRVKYICYALPKTEEEPPQDFANACFFVPVSPLTPETGFFVLYQSAATGESIKPQNA